MFKGFGYSLLNLSDHSISAVSTAEMRGGKIQFSRHSHAFLPLFYSWLRQEVINLQSEE